MPDRPPFPIPDDLTPDTFCLCLEIPNDPIWKTVIAGLLWMPGEWFNWQRDESSSGKTLAHYWRNLYNQIDWSTMSCCCDNNEILYQWTPDGHYQESTDGGTTYTDAPAADPRNPQPKFPPYLPPDTLDEECTYADSIVQMIKTQIVDVLEDGATYSEIIGIIISVFTTLMGALAPTVIGSIVIGILGAIAVGIVTLSIPAFQAAMTTAVYDRLRCNLACHMADDGTFTQADVDAIYAQISSDETGMAALFLQGFVAAAGVIGLTNAARFGLGAPDADCTECCPDCLASWAIFGAGHGSIVEVTDTYIEVASSPDTGGDCYLIMKTPTVGTCCLVDHVDILTGVIGLHGWTDCGQPQVEGVPQFTGLGWGGCINYIQMQDGNEFTARIYFVNC